MKTFGGGGLQVLISAQEPFIVFSLPCPLVEGSERADLVGAWHPAVVKPHTKFHGFTVCQTVCAISILAGRQNHGPEQPALIVCSEKGVGLHNFQMFLPI